MKISGIDVGGTAIKYVMTDRSAEISKINDENQEEDEELFNSLDEIISQNIDEIDGVVISFPEKINSKNGIVHTARAFMWICDLALKSILEEKYSQPVWILMNNL